MGGVSGKLCHSLGVGQGVMPEAVKTGWIQGASDGRTNRK